MAIAIIRTLILYTAIVVSLRIMGKRQIGELEPAELVVAVLISDLAAHPLQDIGTPLLYGLLPVLILLCCEVLVSALLVKSNGFRTFLCGKPSMLIRNGIIVQRELKKNRFTLDELAEQLRKKEVTDISSIKYAILETDGTLSTLRFAAQAAVTPSQLGTQPEEIGYPLVVINDGKIQHKNLKKLGVNDKWLQNQLNSRHMSSAADVFLMTADETGRVYFAAMEGQQ